MTKASNTDLAIEEYGYKQVKKYKIPNDWQLVKLGDFAIKIGSGKTPKGGESVYQDRGIPFIRSQNVLNNKLELDGVSFISDVIHNEMKSTKVIANDVLLNITGASIGRCCVVPNSFEEGNVNQHVCIIRTKENLDRNFLVNILLSPIGQNQIFSNQAGGNREGLNFEQIRKLDIPLPPIKEQQKIALIMSTWDKAIELKEKLIEQKKEQKKGLMERLLTSKQRLKGFKEEWELKKVKDIAEIYLGLTYTPKYVSEGVPFLSVKDLDGDKLDFSNTKYISREEFESSTSNAKPLKGDILFGRVGTLGNPIVLNEDMAFCIFVSLGFLRMKNESSLNYFVKYWMQSNLFKKQIESQVAGSSQKNLNTGWLKEFELKMPNLNEQKAIVKVLSGMDNEVNLLKQELNLLKQQKQALMQQLLTGKIRVKI